MKRVIVSLSILIVFASSALRAEEKLEGLQAGGSAIISGVAFASGEWKKHRDYICPAAARGSEPKFAIYTETLDDNVMKLAAAVENRIKTDERLKWSFVEVLDRKGARGQDGYSKSELELRLDEIRKRAADFDIKRLTFGVPGRSRAAERERLAMPEKINVVIAFLSKFERRPRQVRFVRHLNSADLDKDTIESLLREIDRIRRSD